MGADADADADFLAVLDMAFRRAWTCSKTDI